MILPSNRICEGLPGVLEDEKGIECKFIIVPGDDSSSRKSVVLTLADVLQVQLAKAALSNGIKLLMEKDRYK